MTSKYKFNDNTHLDKKQTILSQYGQINTIKKNKKDNNHKDNKKPKKEKKDIGSPTKDIVDVSLKVLIPINWLINPRIFM